MGLPQDLLEIVNTYVTLTPSKRRRDPLLEFFVSSSSLSENLANLQGRASSSIATEEAHTIHLRMDAGSTYYWVQDPNLLHMCVLNAAGTHETTC